MIYKEANQKSCFQAVINMAFAIVRPKSQTGDGRIKERAIWMNCV